MQREVDGVVVVVEPDDDEALVADWGAASGDPSSTFELHPAMDTKTEQTPNVTYRAFISGTIGPPALGVLCIALQLNEL